MRNVCKSYDSQEVISNFSFLFRSGSRYAIVGPSGTGKSTLLDLISGLTRPSSGEVSRLKPITVGYSFQTPPLLPWRTVQENVALAYEVSPSDPNPNEIDKLLHLFRLFEARNKYPNELSGGMRQRVGILQSLILRPDLLILDEPFAGIDYEIKLNIERFLLGRYPRGVGGGLIIVTHDIEDAIAMADEVLILSGSPATLKSVVAIDIATVEADPFQLRLLPQFAQYLYQVRGALGW